MRHYETIYIMNPNLSEDEHKEVAKKFNGLVEKEKGVIVKVEEWGKQKLPYPLKKFDRGSYARLDYCGEPGITRELERELKLDDRILKYQTVKLADKVDPQELVKMEKGAEKEGPGEEDQPVENVKEEIVKKEDKAPLEEVKNGV